MKGYLYFEEGIKPLFAISSVFAIIGTVKVYTEFYLDSDKTRRTALKWYGTSFLLFVVAFIFTMIYDIFLK